MTDNRNNHPLDPIEDQVLDQYLASLGHLSPAQGFQDRVMARVRVAAAAPALAPAAVAGTVVRRRRWPVLAGSLTGAAALSSTALTAWVATNLEALMAWTTASVATLALPAWHAALTWLSQASAEVGSTLLTGAVTAGWAPLIWAFVLLNLAVPVSALGLFLVARPHVRMSTHVAR